MAFEAEANKNPQSSEAFAEADHFGTTKLSYQSHWDFPSNLS